MATPPQFSQSSQTHSKSPNYIQKSIQSNLNTNITKSNSIDIPIHFLNESFNSSLSIGQTQSSLNISLTKSEKELKEEIERITKLIEEKQTSINNYQTLIKEVRYIYILLIYLKYYIERKHNCES